jgi:leucyl/phenylalanyl-tRNA--protein transferase
VPVYRLDRRLVFPPVEEAEEGLLAVGGDLRAERLILAYSRGIFPWYGEDEPILWHSPDPRAVLRANELHVPASLARMIRRTPFRLTLDTAFAEVITACAAAPRPGMPGTWITAEMQQAYIELHRRGLAHSVETWREGRLVGGLYGVSLGGAFFGESMFRREADASKVAFVALVEQLVRWEITLVDCQVQSEHLARFGAEEWPRPKYLAALAEALARPTRSGRWQFDRSSGTAEPGPPPAV